MSGVSVPTSTMSISSGSTPESSSAFRAASTQRSEFGAPGSAMWRVRIPVRSVIHASLVSTIFSRSELVSSFGGAYIPSPMIFDPNASPPLRSSYGFAGAPANACPRDAMDRAISTSTPKRAREPAARIPFLIARWLDDPWQMKTPPRTPSSGAPPYSS